MQIETLADPDAVARRAAEFVAAEARAAVAARGRFVVAVSGGTTPWVMLRELSKQDVPWPSVMVVQVDERAAPEGHADRNLTHLRASLHPNPPLKPEQILAMPVEEDDLEAAAHTYARQLEILVGPEPVLDLVHLGLGPDGHTASLIPGDPVLDVSDRDVATTGVYQGRRRMTLTYPIINRARKVLWLVTGANKAEMLRRVRDADPTIPGGRVRGGNATVLADTPAAAGLTS